MFITCVNNLACPSRSAHVNTLFCTLAVIGKLPTEPRKVRRYSKWTQVVPTGNLPITASVQNNVLTWADLDGQARLFTQVINISDIPM